MSVLRWLAYQLYRWHLKRMIALCAYRRAELDQIVLREKIALDYAEHNYNRKLRELQSHRLYMRAGRI